MVTAKNKNIVTKIIDPNCPIILYELIPPDVDNISTCMEAYTSCAIEMLSSTSITIDGINIPEIHDESIHRQSTMHKTKIDPRHFANLLYKEAPNKIDIILNHCVAHESLDKQKNWLHTTFNDYQLSNLILVGGESSLIHYPGPSVIEMAQYLQHDCGNQFFLGGITIPMRRHNNLAKDEPYRLLEKANNGINFFTSQVIYEEKSTQQLLKDYYNLCLQHNTKPKRLFLSFAPITSQKDLEFLKWLGVHIPDDTAKFLLETDLGIGWRSIKTCLTILQSIYNFMHEENIKIPLGLNIEYISRHNFELTKELIETLGSYYHSAFRSI
jgi:5,10-methylenetetrahydrofolate reductase